MTDRFSVNPDGTIRDVEREYAAALAEPSPKYWPGQKVYKSVGSGRTSEQTVVKVGRLNVTVTAMHGRTEAYRIADGRMVNARYGEHIWTQEEIDARETRADFRRRLKEQGFEVVARSTVPDYVVESVVLMLESMDKARALAEEKGDA